MSRVSGDNEVTRLADWAVDVQRRHFEDVRKSSLALAEDETRAG